MKTAIIVTLIIIAQALPYPKQKDRQCATDYTESGGYCVPKRSDSPPAVPKVGSCPSGWRESGGACVRMRG